MAKSGFLLHSLFTIRRWLFSGLGRFGFACGGEAERVLLATEKSLNQDADLLDSLELGAINDAIIELKRVLGRGPEGDRAKASKATTVQVRLDALDEATHAWAGRRMNRAIASTLAGQDVFTVEGSVQGARGVDAHVEEHERNRGAGQSQGN